MAQIITNWVCQLSCRHCLWSCGPTANNKRISTYEAERFFRIMGGCGESLNIVGGEATLHKELFEILKLSFMYFHDVRIVTNGVRFINKDGRVTAYFNKFVSSVVEILYLLKGTFYIHLSDDQYHIEANYEIKRYNYSPKSLQAHLDFAFDCEGYGNDKVIVDIDRFNGYRESTLPIGRALKNDLPCSYKLGCDCDSGDDDYHCAEFTLLPDGNIASCCNAGAVLCHISDISSWSSLYDRFEESFKVYPLQKRDCRKCAKKSVAWLTKKKITEQGELFYG